MCIQLTADVSGPAESLGSSNTAATPAGQIVRGDAHDIPLSCWFGEVSRIGVH